MYPKYRTNLLTFGIEFETAVSRSASDMDLRSTGCILCYWWTQQLQSLTTVAWPQCWTAIADHHSTVASLAASNHARDTDYCNRCSRHLFVCHAASCDLTVHCVNTDDFKVNVPFGVKSLGAQGTLHQLRPWSLHGNGKGVCTLHDTEQFGLGTLGDLRHSTLKAHRIRWGSCSPHGDGKRVQCALRQITMAACLNLPQQLESVLFV